MKFTEPVVEIININPADVIVTSCPEFSCEWDFCPDDV
jgi:hypothetical protein